jgi:hypothetical protein
MQAISLIVTHRTDDMSLLPKTGTTGGRKVAGKVEEKKFKLKLPGAPQAAPVEVHPPLVFTSIG